MFLKLFLNKSLFMSTDLLKDFYFETDSSVMQEV